MVKFKIVFFMNDMDNYDAPLVDMGHLLEPKQIIIVIDEEKLAKTIAAARKLHPEAPETLIEVVSYSAFNTDTQAVGNTIARTMEKAIYHHMTGKVPSEA